MTMAINTYNTIDPLLTIQHTFPLYGSGGRHFLTLAAKRPNRCLSVHLRMIFVGSGTSAWIWGGMGTKTGCEKPNFMFRRWPFPPPTVPRGSSSSAALYPTPTRYNGTEKPSVIPIIALWINVRVSPHIDLCFFTSASSTATVTVWESRSASRTKGISETDVAPRGPFTETAVGDISSETLGGNFMGSLPM